MHKTSAQAQKALERFRKAFYVEGYASVRDRIGKQGRDWVMYVDIAYEGTRTCRFRTLADIHAACERREAKCQA